MLRWNYLLAAAFAVVVFMLVLTAPARASRAVTAPAPAPAPVIRIDTAASEEQPITATPTPSSSPTPTATPTATPAPPRPRVTPRPSGPVAASVYSPPKWENGVLVGSRQQELTNQARMSAGLSPLSWSTCLANIAASHSTDMANAGYIFHGDGVQRDLNCGLGSTHSGENVGDTSAGVNDQLIFNAFMNSPDHRANIMGSYRFIGTAWAIGSNGYGYITVEFAS